MKNASELTDKTKHFSKRDSQQAKQMEIHKRQIALLNQRLNAAIIAEETAKEKVKAESFKSRPFYADLIKLVPHFKFC